MTSYTIVVTPLIGAGSELANNEVSLSLGNNTFGDYYAFGTQPPILNQDQVLNLVTDSQEPSKGPAWFFEMPYNKIVILPEAALTPPGAVSKRGNGVTEEGKPSGGFMRKNVAQPGDRPWFCYWNGTLLEALYTSTSPAVQAGPRPRHQLLPQLLSPVPMVARFHPPHRLHHRARLDHHSSSSFLLRTQMS